MQISVTYIKERRENLLSFEDRGQTARSPYLIAGPSENRRRTQEQWRNDGVAAAASPLHAFTPGLKLSFSANPSHHSLPFLLLD